MEWQGRHLWNEISPLAASWADAASPDAAIIAAATNNVLIFSSPLCCGAGRAPLGPQPKLFKRAGRNVSTAKIAIPPCACGYGPPFPAIMTTARRWSGSMPVLMPLFDDAVLK